MLLTVKNLWLIPALPLLAAGIGALLKRQQRRAAAALAIGAMAGSLFLSLAVFVGTLPPASRVYSNFAWFDMGQSASVVRLGWVLDPLAAVMLVMVSLVGLLIFVYSVGYMGKDENFTRFFCFLSLFAAAMLGVVIANSLLLFFICWELVGLASYLLIGFWYFKPAAAAAAKKAFITTRVGDLGFLLGILWLYQQTGTLLFYDNDHGCLEQSALTALASHAVLGGIAASTCISLLVFCGAIGKSGQLPLHVWLPDAMEGPTPVSALIHAATMVAAGVFLVARVYPLMAAGLPGAVGSTALSVVTWTGAVTAVFAALIATAQNDIKRILAYSTISQLGYMMMGLGVGGVAVGMFHLIAHAFFKALLFLGAGSVIHGIDGEQDIRKMGGIRRCMPLTFGVYAVGMMALCGVPLLFCGFWSKDEILHAAYAWPVSRIPFYLGIFGAFLTAFYMTRQVRYVFFGIRPVDNHPPHESPPVITVPLIILAVLTVLFGFAGTPAWPWFQQYLEGQTARFNLEAVSSGMAALMGASTAMVGLGIFWAWRLYARAGGRNSIDPLQQRLPALFALLAGKFFIDEFYGATVVRLNALTALLADWFDRWVWGGLVQLTAWLVAAFAFCARECDERAVNGGFDRACETMRGSGRNLSGWQDGQLQHYLRVIGSAVVVLALLLLWGCK
jgi:NADH-quinone oxidoreductase subunit L